MPLPKERRRTVLVTIASPLGEASEFLRAGEGLWLVAYIFFERMSDPPAVSRVIKNEPHAIGFANTLSRFFAFQLKLNCEKEAGANLRLALIVCSIRCGLSTNALHYSDTQSIGIFLSCERKTKGPAE